MIYNELIERGTDHFPIELYHVNKNHPRYEMSSHWHSEIELMRIVSGKLQVKLDSNEYLAKKGDLIFVNPETVHSAFPIGECVYDCIVMRFDMLKIEDESCRHFIDGILGHDIVINEFNSNSSKKFSYAMNYLFDSMDANKPGYKFSVMSSLYDLLGAVIDNCMYTSVSDKKHNPNNKNILKLKRVLSFIRNNYDKQITLNEMAKINNMSQKYFCTFFKEMTRKTPVEYLILYRIECAARKLCHSDMSVTEIALSCGFNDLSYFIKTFKNIKGVTPLKFRNKKVR